MEIWQSIRVVSSLTWDGFNGVSVFAKSDNTFALASAAKTEGSDPLNPAGYNKPIVAQVEAFGWAPQDAWQSLFPLAIIQPVGSDNPFYNYDIERLENGHWLVAWNNDTGQGSESETFVAEFDGAGNGVFSAKVADNTTAPPGYWSHNAGSPDLTVHSNGTYTITFGSMTVPLFPNLTQPLFHYGTGTVGAAPSPMVVQFGNEPWQALEEFDSVFRPDTGNTVVYWIERSWGPVSTDPNVFSASLKTVAVTASGSMLGPATTLHSGNWEGQMSIDVASNNTSHFIVATFGPDLLFVTRDFITGDSDVLSLKQILGLGADRTKFRADQIEILKNGNVVICWSDFTGVADAVHVTILTPDGVLVDDFSTTAFEDFAGCSIAELTDGRIVLAGGVIDPSGIQTATPDDAGYIILDPRPDTINGTSGDDFIIGKTGKGENIYGDAGNDRLYTLSTATDFAIGRLYGGNGADLLYGDEGVDALYGDAGADYLEGKGGDDGLWGGANADTLKGGQGDDDLFGDAGADKLYGDTGVDVLTGGLDNDTLWGEDGSDYLYGEHGNDNLQGGDDTDFLYGGDGDDNLNGGSAIDLLEGGAGADAMNGGGGQDTVTYANSTSGVGVVMGASAWIQGNGLGDAQGDTFSNVEIIRLSNHSDYIAADNLNSELSIFGLDGDDTIFASKGGGRLNGGNGDDGFVLNGTLFPGGSFLGGRFVIRGDEIGGVQGKDLISLFNHVAGLTVDMSTATTRNGTFSFIYGGQTQTAYGDIDGIGGTLFGDILIGNNFNNKLEGVNGHDDLRGGGGADELLGQIGNDRLTGGAGADNMTGEEGADTFVFLADTDIVAGEIIDGGAAAVAGEADTIEIAGGDYDFRSASVLSIEAINFTGTNTDSKIILSASQIGAGLAANALIGATTPSSGSATVDVRMVAAGALDLSGLIFGAGWNGGHASANDRFLITGSTGADTVIATSTADFVRGGDGDDVLNGGVGADRLRGDVGADRLRGGADADQFVYVDVTDSEANAAVRDVILDFEGGSDKINVNAIDANALLAGQQNFVLDTDGILTAGEFRIRQVGSQLIEFNTDGDADIEMQILVSGVGNVTGVADFIL